MNHQRNLKILFRRAAEIISNFQHLWRSLGLSITPKHHLLTSHYLSWCRKNDMTPMVFSENDIESAHRYYAGRLGFYRPGLSRALAMAFQNGLNMERSPSRGESFLISMETYKLEKIKLLSRYFCKIVNFLFFANKRKLRKRSNLPTSAVKFVIKI